MSTTMEFSRGGTIFTLKTKITTYHYTLSIPYDLATAKIVTLP